MQVILHKVMTLNKINYVKKCPFHRPTQKKIFFVVPLNLWFDSKMQMCAEEYLNNNKRIIFYRALCKLNITQVKV